jgi:hypothetical protein
MTQRQSPGAALADSVSTDMRSPRNWFVGILRHNGLHFMLSGPHPEHKHTCMQKVHPCGGAADGFAEVKYALRKPGGQCSVTLRKLPRLILSSC